MRRLEGDEAVKQHHGAHVLHADVRHVAVVDGVGALVRNTHHQPFDLSGLDLVLADQVEQAVERGLDRRTDRPALDIGVHDFVGRAEPADEYFRLGGAAVRDEEIALPGEHVFDRRKTVRDHRGRGGAVARRHAAEIERFFDVLFVAHPARHARRLLRRIREQMPHLARIEPAQGAGRRRRAEHRPEAVGRVAILAELVGIERQIDAAADVVAERHRAQERSAVAPLALGHRKCRRHDRAAGMAQRRRVRIVGLVGVTEHAVGERSIDRGGHETAADDRRLFRAAERLDVRNRFFAGQEPRARDHRRQRVEHVVLGLLGDLFGQGFFRGRGDIGADLLHDGGNLRRGFGFHEFTRAATLGGGVRWWESRRGL